MSEAVAARLWSLSVWSELPSRARQQADGNPIFLRLLSDLNWNAGPYKLTSLTVPGSVPGERIQKIETAFAAIAELIFVTKVTAGNCRALETNE